MCFAKCPPLAASVVIAATFLACHVSDPVQPQLSSNEILSPELSQAPADCPSFHQACRLGYEAVTSACPVDGGYKKASEYNRCVRIALRKYMKTVSSCFSRAEREDLRECIRTALPRTSDGSDTKEKVPVQCEE
jgi:hypothetical protein